MYYFDEQLLNEIVTHYAKGYVSEARYYSLETENIYGELTEEMFDNLWTAGDGTQAPCANGYVFLEHDSTAVYAALVGGSDERVPVRFGIPFGEQFSETGLYLITERDEAGNEAAYYVFLDTAAPALTVNAEVYGAETAVEVTITKESAAEFKAYYYKTFAVSGLLDNDSWAVLALTSAEQTQYFTHGDALPTLNIGGEYLVSVYDRIGNGYTFTVYIVGNEAGVTFTPTTNIPRSTWRLHWNRVWIRW